GPLGVCSAHMDVGIVTAKIDEIGYITHAENLGYSHAWITDSPMIRSNCWAVLALAAHQTRTIRLGTGVNVPGLRLAPAVANGIATINRLAPGRCFISLGTGHTGMRLLGQRPMRLEPFREYIEAVRGLLRGEEIDYTLGGETHRIRFRMREHRFIDLEDPPEYARPVWKAYLEWLAEFPPAIRHQRLHASHYSFLDPEEARFVTAELIDATCLSGAPEELAEKVRALERAGLSQIMLYPPLNRQYRVIEDFADKVMARL